MMLRAEPWVVVAFGLAFAGCGKDSSTTENSTQSATRSKSASVDSGIPQSDAGRDRLSWNISTLGDAYEKVGKRNGKWNHAAREALDGFARLRFNRDSAGRTDFQFVATNCAVAVAAGCDDPLIAYLHARYVLANRNIAATALAESLRKAAESLNNSLYPPIRKFYASLRAAEQLKSVAGTNTPPEVHDFRRLAIAYIAEALEDKTMPIGEVDDACHDILRALKVSKVGYEACYRRIERPLFANWPNEATTFLLKGEFHLKYAWFGRGAGYANGVSEEGWKLFAERLAVAATALEKAWELNPRDARIPTTMIDVEEGQGKGRARMELWFDRAMSLDPNNYEACSKKLHYLYPQWYGSREEMIAFGKQCASFEKWGGTVPLILSDAHREYWLYLEDAAVKQTYWNRPDVWPEIQMSFERFFQVNSNATGWYHNYAWHAYKCEQWEKLNELVPKLGRVNFDYFGGKDEYDKMVRRAREKAANPGPK